MANVVLIGYVIVAFQDDKQERIEAEEAEKKKQADARKRQTIHTARCEFTLDRSAAVWRIRRKKVNLLRNGEVLESTPFLI